MQLRAELLPRPGLLLAPQLLFKPYDLALVLSTELLQLLLLIQGEHWLVVGILECLPPPFHLLGEQTPLPAVGDEFSGIEASGRQHHRELFGGTPTLRVFLGCLHDFTLEPPGFPQFVEGDHMDVQLLCDPGTVLTVQRTHPPSDISFDPVAVTTHKLAQSSPLVKTERNRGASTFLTEGGSGVPSTPRSTRSWHSWQWRGGSLGPVRTKTLNQACRGARQLTAALPLDLLQAREHSALGGRLPQQRLNKLLC